MNIYISAFKKLGIVKVGACSTMEQSLLWKKAQVAGEHVEDAGGERWLILKPFYIYITQTHFISRIRAVRRFAIVQEYDTRRHQWLGETGNKIKHMMTVIIYIHIMN